MAMNRDDLVKRMIEAWVNARHEHNVVDSAHERMSAALLVALDSFENSFKRAYKGGDYHPMYVWNKILGFFKTPEERVLVEQTCAPHDGLFKVLLDGEIKYRFQEPEQAQTYRLGLIAQLKSE